MAKYCEPNNKPSRSTKAQKFLHQMINNQLLKSRPIVCHGFNKVNTISDQQRHLI
jgi:hypothetical protein